MNSFELRKEYEEKTGSGVYAYNAIGAISSLYVEWLEAKVIELLESGSQVEKNSSHTPTEC